MIHSSIHKTNVLGELFESVSNKYTDIDARATTRLEISMVFIGIVTRIIREKALAELLQETGDLWPETGEY